MPAVPEAWPLAEFPQLHGAQTGGWLRLEFTNWTHEKLSAGGCSEDLDMAFEGLCSWESSRAKERTLAGSGAHPGQSP
ncbi:unnamed protein product [Prorocentrum cordatum]|uniref:Uncharacterized protein n=1 Tax=Prorocentrum cordatum TaxID=2364126 RepID=A0ABN9PXV4_9DINO|nr:unnamed protein product [Polarella glacialis]